MSTASKIEWTDRTWNPVTGCTRVSAGCKNCYAEGAAARFWRGRKFTDVFTHADRLDGPLRWRKPMRVFVNSMSDLFHEDVPDEFVDRVFAVMALSPQHTFQVLTKRPARMQLYMSQQVVGQDEGFSYGDRIALVACHVLQSVPDRLANVVARRTGLLRPVWPLPNVWLGVSVEDQRAVGWRVPVLLKTPAAVRFLSCEPLLGPLEFSDVTKRSDAVQQLGKAALAGIDWVIVGGESGPGARPCDVAWIRSIVEQCKAAGVACFVKQLGARPHDSDAMKKHADRNPRLQAPRSGPATEQDAEDLRELMAAASLGLRDRKGGDTAEWPEDLRVREFPAGGAQ